MAAGVSDRPKEAVKRKLVFGLASDKTLADLKNAEAALKEANTEMNKSTQRLARTTRRVNRRTKKADYSAGHLPRGLSSEQMHDSVTLAQKRSTFLQSRMAEASSSSASSSSIASSSIASSSIASSSITSSSIASSSITSSPLSSASSCIPALVSASSSAPAPSSSASLSVSASLLATSLTPPAPSDIPKVSLDDAEADTDILDIGEYENPGYLDALLPIDAGIDLANIQMQVDSMPGPLNIGDESMSAQAAEDAEDERHQPELTDIPIREMHTFFMHHLIEKHEIKKEFDKARREDGTYVCPSCPAYRHRPPTVSSGVAHHQRHLDMLHSEWMDLEVRCYIGEEGFACPYCDQEFDDMTATREHMTEDADCPGYHSVRIMAIRHQRMTDVYRKRKSSATFEKTANKGDGFDDRHKELIKRGKAKALGKDTLFHRHCTLVVNAVQKDDEAPANVVNYIVDFVQMMRKRLHQQKPIGYNDFPSHV
ncbi:hypothetical protein CPB85DRAFT_754178 [Mucidula mucida]|nr:hypothetical protein CPB85DRAFT_754178 [Mucidula mucida]